MKTDPPAFLKLPALADRLGRSTSWLRDLRNRDSRFPIPDASGRFPVLAVLLLLRLRELEKMTPEEFASEEADRRRELLADMLPGGPLAFLGASARRRIEALPARTRAEALREAANDFQAMI